jgi:hypothetical protein
VPELERLVLSAARSILANQAAWVKAIEDNSEEAANLEQLLDLVSGWRERLSGEAEARAALGELIKQVQLTGFGLRVTINIPMVAAGTQVKEGFALSHFVPLTMKRRGVELRLILDGRADEPREVDAALLKALARAHVWFGELACGSVGSLAEIARREGLKKRYVARLAKLAFVAPPIAEAITAGHSPIGINLQMLMDGRLKLTPYWCEQQRIFGGVDSYH